MEEKPKWEKKEWNLDNTLRRHLTKSPMEVTEDQREIRKMLALERIADAFDHMSDRVTRIEQALERISDAAARETMRR